MTQFNRSSTDQHDAHLCDCVNGAMLHALPVSFSRLKRLSVNDMAARISPWVGKVPPKNQQHVNAWLAHLARRQQRQNIVNGLHGLDELAELDGFRKRLKRAFKKVVDVHKKIGKALTSKKLAKPFAFVLGAATGTLPLMMDINNLRNKMRAGRAAASEAKNQAAAEAQAEAEAQQQQQAEQAEYDAQQAAYNAQLQQQQQAQRSYQPPQPSYVSAPQQAQFNPIQRLQPDDGQEDQPRVVGLSAAGIMDHIKANPIPWAIGAGLAVYVVTRPKNQPRAA